jgi:hypothetical protein
MRLPRLSQKGTLGMNDYIVTEIEFDEKKYLAAAFFEDMRLSMLKFAARDDESLIGRIYLGHIDS